MNRAVALVANDISVPVLPNGRDAGGQQPMTRIRQDVAVVGRAWRGGRSALHLGSQTDPE